MTQPSTEQELEDAITEAYAEEEAARITANNFEAIADEWDERAYLLECELRILRGGQ